MYNQKTMVLWLVYAVCNRSPEVDLVTLIGFVF